MPRRFFYFPTSEGERLETLKEVRYMKSLDMRSAYTSLRIAARDYCSTRDELVIFVWDEGLVPYLRFFLEHQGWLDE